MRGRPTRSGFAARNASTRSSATPGRKLKWHHDSILAAFHREAERMGRCPSLRELEAAAAEGRAPWASQVFREFGSYSTLCQEAGYEPRRPGPQSHADPIIAALRRKYKPSTSRGAMRRKQMVGASSGRIPRSDQLAAWRLFMWDAKMMPRYTDDYRAEIASCCRAFDAALAVTTKYTGRRGHQKPLYVGKRKAA